MCSQEKRNRFALFNEVFKYFSFACPEDDSSCEHSQKLRQDFSWLLEGYATKVLQKIGIVPYNWTKKYIHIHTLNMTSFRFLTFDFGS